MADIYLHILSRTFYLGHSRTWCTIFSMLNLVIIFYSPRLIARYFFSGSNSQRNGAIEYIDYITSTRIRSQSFE
jgi:hypothetical protein